MKAPNHPKSALRRKLFSRWQTPAMRQGLDRFERSRAVTVLLLAALAWLLVTGLRDLGGRIPRYAPGRAPTNAVVNVAYLSPGKLAETLGSPAWPRLQAGTNAANPFFTTHFQPPPPPPPAPAPKPPTTRKVDLVYQGFFQTAAGAKHAFVKVDTNTVVGPPGTKVVADLAVQDMNFRSLTLTNRSAQTNVLEFNQKKTVEVPM